MTAGPVHSEGRAALAGAAGRSLRARVRGQTSRFYSSDRADLVIIAGVSGDADRADRLSVRIADQHAAGRVYQSPLGRVGRGGDEARYLCRARC